MNEIAETNVRNICKKLFNHTTGTNYHFGILKLHIQDEDLKEIYLPRIEAHNNQALNERFPDSGFDLIVPDDVMFDKPFETTTPSLLVLLIATEIASATDVAPS